MSPTGAATYSIPIQLPPGVAGLAPHLALVYDSQMGNALAGYGWMLSGLSVLTVCNKTYAQDGINQGVSFAGTSPDTNDYCLDGAKLLPTSSGANTYRKERDDFSQITAESSGGAGPTTTSGPQWFEVQTSDGLIYEYGKTADSEIVAAGPGIPSGITMARAWALDQIYDKYGNSVSFSYSQDTTNGDFWPVQITYTNHGSTAGPHSIVFTYTSLASINPGLVWTSYLAGALISQTQRLSEIDVDYNDSPTFKYTLSYETTLTDANGQTGTERSRLKTVNECAGGTCYPATAITWQKDVSGWSATQSVNMEGNNIPDQTHAAAMHLIDVNGDGRADVVYPGSTDWMIAFADGTGFDAPFDTGVPVGNYKDAMPIDIDGSGHTGLLEPDVNNNWQVLVPVATSSSPGGYTLQAINLYDKATGQPLPATGADGNATVTDVNGDGLDDVLFTDGTNLLWLENVGGGNAAYDLAPAATLVANAFGGSGNSVFKRNTQFADAIPDFDGTGHGGFMTYTEPSANLGCTPDYCPPPPTPNPVWSMFEGGGVNSAPTSLGKITGSPGNLVVPTFVDFNGDGLTDLLYADGTATDGSNWTWRVYNSTGVGLSGGDTGILWTNTVMSADGVVVDYAGNGREQVMLPLYKGGTCSADWALVGYAGGVFHGAQDLGVASPVCDSGYESGSMRTGDITGNGFTDLVWVENEVIHYALHQGPHPDLVTQIANGFNQTWNIAYQPLANGANYSGAINWYPPTRTYPATSGTATVPETRPYMGALYVVSNYSANDGVGGTLNDSFGYTGALLDTLGRGFLGFASTTVTDSRASVNTTTVNQTSYDQLFPETGEPNAVTLSVNGNTEQSASTTWTATPTLGGAQYVYASSTSTSDNELGVTSPYRTVSTTTTPTLSSASGVITEVQTQTTTTPATVTSKTTTNYQVDTGNWCLSLPASVTVENVGANPNNEIGGSDITRTVTYTPDTSHCRLTGKSVSVTDGSTSETLATGYGYDPTDGNLSTQTVTATTNGAQQQFITKYGYDPTNTFVASVTNPLNETSTATWDPTLGTELSSTDPNGVMTKFGYDAFGLKTSETLGDGTSINWSYCLPANSCSVSNGAYSMTATHESASNVAGKTETTVYDSFGRPVLSSTYVFGGAQTNVATAYDALGRVVSVSTPYEGNPTTYTYTTYDAFSRPSAVYTPPGENSGCSATYQNVTTCETVYGYNGLTTQVTDPKGNVTTKTVDALGEVTAVTNGYGSATAATTQYGYDPFGDLTQTTDASLNKTTMSYDTLGRKLSMTDPDMGAWTYGYDPRGLLTSQTDPKSQIITMQYDALGRMTSRTVPLASGGSGTDTWTYDGPNGVSTAPNIGKLVEVQGADGYIKQYQYDSAGRPLETDVTINGTTYATNTAYDSFGRVASVTYPSTPVPLADDPPVAVAGASQAGIVGQTFTLDGSGSYDPDNGPQPLTYKWVQTSGPVDTSADGATTADVSFSTTTAGTYDFTLTVSDGQLTDSASTAVTVTPAQVTGLSASAVDPNTGDFTLSWSPTQGASSYSVEQSENGGGYSLLPQSYSGTSAALTGYGNGNYSFAVQGCGNSVCGGFSAAVTVSVARVPVTPGTPSLSPNPTTTGDYTVSWSAVATATSYTLYSSTDGSSYTAASVGNTTSQAEHTAVNGSTYYKLAACNSAGCSAASGVAVETAAPLPGAPVLSPSTQTITAGGSASFSWNPQGTAATEYVLQRKSGSGSWSTIYTGGATSYTDSPPGTTGVRYYQVQGCNSLGCGAWSNSVSVGIQSSGCRTCSPVNATQTTAPSGSSTAPTTAPSASSSTPPASGSGLTMTRVEGAGTGARVILASAPVRSASKQSREPQSSAAVELTRLRQQALHIEALRIAEQPAHSAPAPQPLYAAEVETPAGLLSAQQAVALGLLNPHRLSDHTERTTAGTSRYQVNYVYDAHGNLTEVVDAADANRIYWTATAGNAFGQVTAELFGNGVINTYGFDANTGELSSLQSGEHSTSLANWGYQWDGDGNLIQRTDSNANLTETFKYDSLNRLTEADVSGASTSSQSFSYDAVGDLKTRTGVGTYNYNSSPQPPMQIASITAPNGTTRSFSYDADGNTLSDGLHSYTWDALNRATAIQDGATGGSEQIAYTPDGARYLETTTLNNASSTLAEITPLFEVQATASYIYYRETIVGGTGPVAVRTIRNDGTLTTRYLSGDHLGSVSIITNEIGGEVEAMSYGPFGERRDPGTWQPYSTSPNLTDITDKGYTGQQMLDAVALIHMNGRVYDPSIGKFISADPVEGPNRYAYVHDNPLRYTDPSGYCTFCLSTFTNPVSVATGIPMPSNTAQNVISQAGQAIAHPSIMFEDTSPIIGHQVNNMMARSGTMQEIGGAAAMVVSYFFGPEVYAGYEAYLTDVQGGTPIQDMESGAVGYMQAYATLSLVNGGITAYNSGPWGMLKFGMNQYGNMEFRHMAAHYANDHGMSLTEFDLALEGISLLGNSIYGSDVHPTADGAYISGWCTRGCSALPFDFVDTALELQGIPSASGLDYMINYRGTPLVGHSLGALTANNMVSLGAAPSAQLYALPIFNFATGGTSLTVSSGDEVTGFGFEGLINPGSTTIDGPAFGHGACAVYNVCY